MKKKKESVNVKRTAILLFTLLCLICVLNPVNARYVGATGIQITHNYVHASSAYPTTSGYYYQRYHNLTWRNRCPNCGGHLNYEIGDYHGADYTSPEGLWYCTHCDMDFSIVSGRSHDHRGYQLTRYKLPPPPVEVVEVEPEPADPIHHYRSLIQSRRII